MRQPGPIHICMRVTDLVPINYPEIIMGPPNESGTGRSQGTLHLSTVYRSMEEDALLARKNEMTPEDLAWYGAGGFLWEHVFSMAYARAMSQGYTVRTGEWECDGIVGSPDSIRIYDWTLIETKFRWMSSNKFDRLEKYFWLELLQIKGYCKLIGTDHAELWVFFCNGDYAPPKPCVRGATLEFSDQEIEESWRAIVQHAKRKGWLQ